MRLNQKGISVIKVFEKKFPQKYPIPKILSKSVFNKILRSLNIKKYIKIKKFKL